MSTHTLEEILHPQSIAVVGASANPDSMGHLYTYQLLAHGYRGRIYPINPRYPEILGLKAYPSLKDIPGSVDYVICSIGASGVLSMLEECSQKGVKCVHLHTGRLSETGRQEEAILEQEILKQARKRGIRLIGPNCMGLYYPKEGIAYSYDLPKEPGSVALVSQSGGGSAFFVQSASLRGIRFSKVISYGNALDLNESDFLDYFSQDPETKIILMYIEGVKDGKRFFNTLRQAAATKPVIITKGGRGKSGARASASHTASLAGSMKTWEAAITQAGAVFAKSLDEMLDIAVSFYFLPPIRGLRVGVAGGGGGPTVLGADLCEEAGLDVIPLPAEIREEFKSKGVPIWDWIGNPADVSIMGGFELTGTDVLELMSQNENFDLLIAIIYEHPLFDKKAVITRHRKQIKGYLKVKKKSSKPLLAVAAEKSTGIKNHNHWRWRAMSEARTKLIAANIPVYPTIERAASAARKLVDYYQRRK